MDKPDFFNDDFYDSIPYENFKYSSSVLDDPVTDSLTDDLDAIFAQFRNDSDPDFSFLNSRLDGSSGIKKSSSACVGLGVIAIFLNFYVIFTLLWHRQKAFKNIFYLLVIHCSTVDFLRAASLIVWFLPEMDLFPIEADDLYRFMKFKQILLIEMRSLNMLTILNLLIFTFNEFVVVKKPLHYRRIVRRQVIILLLIFSWFTCFVFGLCSVLSRNYTPPSPMVRRNMSLDEQINSSHAYTHITRHPRGEHDESLQYVFIFAVIAICALCMLVVFTCYAQIMLRVRQFHRFDSIRSLSVTNDSLARFRGSISSCTVERKRRRLQIVVRHKYLLVIGLVLFVDVIFLVPYSYIQIMQYVYISHGNESNGDDWSSWTQTRWISQLLMALHSVLQPLCYFRMEEFRRLATCQRINSMRGGEGNGKGTGNNRTTSCDEQLAALTEDEEEILMLTMGPNGQGYPMRLRANSRC